jgi:glycosyltransferase involved in cell wall biosynthesis
MPTQAIVPNAVASKSTEYLQQLAQIWKAPITSVIIKIGALLSGNIPDLIIITNQARENHIRMGFEETKMRVIHNGIDPDIFQPDEEARRIIREELITHSSELLIGMAARFHPQKDHRTFIEAASLIRNRISESRFVLCEGMDASNKELSDG